MNSENSASLAKIIWSDPQSGEKNEFVLMEGATVTIGRSSTNDIYIPEQHVSRQHAVINYRDGVFMLNDLNSANGTFVNDIQIEEPFPLASGDVIRLYVPILEFSSIVTEQDTLNAQETGTLIPAAKSTGGGKLIITTGPQEGEIINLTLDKVTIGRATTNYTWEIGLQDPSVSRPHAQIARKGTVWLLSDLGSSNGTMVNNTPLPDKGRYLADGDIIAFGATLVVFRSS